MLDACARCTKGVLVIMNNVSNNIMKSENQFDPLFFVGEMTKTWWLGQIMPKTWAWFGK